ncbi:MAG: translation initiation factor IF-2 N-terminal domain-containing protein, partial [Chloroflexota bacterium]
MSDQVNKKVELPANISIRDFAQLVEVSPIQIIKKLMTNGVMASINQTIDFDTAAILADEMGFEATLESQTAPVEKESGEVSQWRQTIADEDE